MSVLSYFLIPTPYSFTTSPRRNTYHFRNASKRELQIYLLHCREHAVDKPGAFVHLLCELNFAPLMDLEVYELETAIITRNIRARRICLCSIRGPREWWPTGFWWLSADEHHHAPRSRNTCLSHCFHIFNTALALMLTLHATNERRRSCTHTPRATCHRKHFGPEIKHCLRQTVHTTRSSKPPGGWTGLQCTHANRRISKEVVQTQEIYFPPSAFTQTSKPEDKSRICCNPGTEVSNLEVLDKDTTRLP